MRLPLETLRPPRKAVVLAFVVAALTTTAVGAAVWSGSGSGSDTLPVETVSAVTLTPAAPTNELYPGTAGDVALSVVNDNTYRAYIGSLVLDTNQDTNGFVVSGGQP